MAAAGVLTHAELNARIDRRHQQHVTLKDQILGADKDKKNKQTEKMIVLVNLEYELVSKLICVLCRWIVVGNCEVEELCVP